MGIGEDTVQPLTIRWRHLSDRPVHPLSSSSSDFTLEGTSCRQPFWASKVAEAALLVAPQRPVLTRHHACPFSLLPSSLLEDGSRLCTVSLLSARHVEHCSLLSPLWNGASYFKVAIHCSRVQTLSFLPLSPTCLPGLMAQTTTQIFGLSVQFRFYCSSAAVYVWLSRRWEVI